MMPFQVQGGRPKKVEQFIGAKQVSVVVPWSFKSFSARGRAMAIVV